MCRLLKINRIIDKINDRKKKNILKIINNTRINYIEKIKYDIKLMENYDLTQEQLSEVVGKSRSHIANIIRLLGLPKSIQDMISQGSISSGHARAIMNSAFPEQLAEKIINENLSVRATEALVKEKKEGPKKVRLKDPDTIDLEKK